MELCSCLPVSHTFKVGGKGLQRWHPLDGHWQSLSHTCEVCKSYAIHCNAKQAGCNTFGDSCSAQKAVPKIMVILAKQHLGVEAGGHSVLIERACLQWQQNLSSHRGVV